MSVWRNLKDRCLLNQLLEAPSARLLRALSGGQPPFPVQRATRRSHSSCIRYHRVLEHKRDALRCRIKAFEEARRGFSTTSHYSHGELTPPKPGEECAIHIPCEKRSRFLMRLRLHVTFIDKEGERHEYEVAEGDNLLDIAQANDLEMEGQLLSYPPTLPFMIDIYNKVPAAVLAHVPHVMLSLKIPTCMIGYQSQKTTRTIC